MTKRKITKRALFGSVIALILCCSMLLGTTFAWFTDRVSSGVNNIVAGNLDIELEYLKDGVWTSVDHQTELFDPDAFWEPGHTEVVYLRVRNAGTLALTYRLSMNIFNETTAISADGQSFKLSQYLKYAVLEDQDTTFATRDDARTAAEAVSQNLSSFSKDGTMLAGEDDHSVALVVYMPESVGNEANYRGDVMPEIQLGINIFASQAPSEFDSFDNQYDAGAAISSTYVGYDGYIWNGSERTDQKAENFSKGDHVIESTMGIQDTMRLYFPGEYVDLTSSQIALLNNYQPYAKLTAYSKAQIAEIQVVSETEGTLYIGTMKVADVVDIRTRAAANGAMYNVNAGANTIALELNVAEDETIVLGGNGSTAKLYVAKGIPTNDQDGNFTLLDGQSHAEVIAQTNGYADTLAVQVSTGSASPIPVFDNVKQWLPESSLSRADAVKHDFAPFVYSNLQYFAGKRITRIDIPVKTVQAGQTPTFTVRVVKQADVRNKNTNMVFGKPQTLTFTQTVDSNTTNTWVTALCDIYVAKDETLAFGATTDTIHWGYKEYSSTQPTYGFYYKVGQSASSVAGTASIYFDVYEDQSFNFSDHLEDLKQKEEQAKQLAQLTSILNGKQLSILGDSISTFTGVSNNASEGLSDNAVYYTSQLTRADTYWQQILTQFNMNLCINNSWSGSYATQHQPNVHGHLDQTGAISSGMARADKLTKKDGTKPDYIVVFIGINDLNASVPSTTFSEAYNQILDTITATYPNAEVFCLNMPNRNGSNPVAYNDAISQAVDRHAKVHLVDLYRSSFSGATYASNSLGDNLHPNANGMDYLSNLIIDKMLATLLPTTA